MRDGVSVVQGGSPTLLAVVADAASARSARAAARCVNIAEGLQAHDAGAWEDALWRMRGVMLTEELAASDVGGRGELGRILSRLLTAFQIGSGNVALMRSTIGALPGGREFARVILASVCEMLHVADSAIRGGEGTEMAVGIAAEAGWLTILVRTGADAGLVLPTDGAAALARVTTIARLARGAVRRRDDGGRLAVAFVVPLSVMRMLLGSVRRA